MRQWVKDHPEFLGFLLAVLVASMLACGFIKIVEKKPEAVQSNSCFVATILHVDENTTYMEIGNEAPKTRVARSGKWGQPGDRFRYCE